jgi:hypothetical protein
LQESDLTDIQLIEDIQDPEASAVPMTKSGWWHKERTRKLLLDAVQALGLGVSREVSFTFDYV